MTDTGSAPSARLAQVAKELHKLADGIGAGKVQISGIDLTLSDSVTLKVKQKMTGSKVVFDLKIQAQLASEETRPTFKNSKKKSRKKSERPYGVKALKKKYTAVWRLVASAIKKGERPSDQAVRDLDAVSREYGAAAPPQWALLWQEHEEMVKQCVEAAQSGDSSTADELLGHINKAKKSCHKAYK